MIRVLEFLGQPKWMINTLAERDPDYNEPTNHEVDAETNYSHQRYVVTLWINPKVYKMDHADQRRIIIHEALHSIHAGIDRLMWSDHTRNLMHDHEHTALAALYCTERELMVDQLSMTLMDLPHLKKVWKEELDE